MQQKKNARNPRPAITPDIRLVLHRAKYYAKALPPILAGTARPAPPDEVLSRLGQPVDGAAAMAQPSEPPLLRKEDDRKSGCGSSESIAWTTARTSLKIGGRAEWDGLERENFFDRFPLASKANVTSGGGGRGIWGLSKCSAGEFVEFAVKGKVTALFVNYSVHDNT